MSGQISRASPNQVLTGRVGDDATVADASAAAEAAVLNLLARINEAIGLANVRQVLKLTYGCPVRPTSPINPQSPRLPLGF